MSYPFPLATNVRFVCRILGYVGEETKSERDPFKINYQTRRVNLNQPSHLAGGFWMYPILPSYPALSPCKSTRMAHRVLLSERTRQFAAEKPWFVINPDSSGLSWSCFLEA